MATAVIVVAGALVAGLTVALLTTVRSQRRATNRLAAVAESLAETTGAAPGTEVPAGLDEAVARVERAVDRGLVRGTSRSAMEERLGDALSAIPQGVVIVDDAGTVVFSNESARHYVGARHGEALVEEAIDQLAEDAVRGAGATRTVELFGPPRRSLVLRSVVLEREGRPRGAAVIIEDVSERRRLEAVRRDFVANISHELKTPVGALGLLAETLLNEEDPAVVQRLAGRMVAEAERVGRTIDDLLELSRIEAAEEARQALVPVEACVDEAVARVGPMAAHREIELSVAPVDGSLTVVGDRRQLVAALANLLDNAIKYSDPGSVVEVRSSSDGTWVEIAVEDHGIGIPRRDLERVFERFYRVDRGRSRETGGTGLGLAIVRHVAGNHRGEVRVSSNEGVGSTFTLRLPVGSGSVGAVPEAG